MKENKKLLLYSSAIFLAILLSYKFPYDTYMIIQRILALIWEPGSGLQLEWIIIIGLYIYGINGLFKLKRFANTSKILMLILIFAVMVPVTKWTLDLTRSAIHSVSGHELKAVDIVDANIRYFGTKDNNISIVTTLELIDYTKEQNQFNVKMILPDDLKKMIGKDYLDFERRYSTYGNRNIRKIEEQFEIKILDVDERERFFTSNWESEDITFKLMNESESISLIKRGW